MKIKVVKYEPNYLEIVVQKETHTLFEPLIEYLLQHPDVELATYDVDHPLLQNVKFRLKTRGRDPLDVLRETVHRVLAVISEFESKLLSKL